MPPKRRSVAIGFGSTSPREIAGFPTPPRKRSPKRTSFAKVVDDQKQQRATALNDPKGGPVQLAPITPDSSAVTLGQSPIIPSQHSQQQQQQHIQHQRKGSNVDESAPCVLEDLMALSPAAAPSSEIPQGRRDTLDTTNPKNLPRPSSATRKGSVTTPAAAANRPVSAGSLPMMESSIGTAASSARGSAAGSGPNTARQQNGSGNGIKLSPQNLAAASAAAAAELGDQAVGKQLRKVTGVRGAKNPRSPRNRGGGDGSGANAVASLTALLNEDASGNNAEEEIVYPLVAALHTARDQLHLPARVIEWMREVLRWNVSANAHEANDKICHLVETVRLVTLELFRMVDEIELLYEKAMTAWRTIPSGADGAGTAKAHATFVDAHGRMRQVAAVFMRLIAKWQQGHAQIFDMVRPAAVGAQPPSAFVFTCAASSNDDYVMKLTDCMDLLETTASSFSNMIFKGAKEGGGQQQQQGNDFMNVPHSATAQRSAGAPRRDSVTVVGGESDDVSGVANISQQQQFDQQQQEEEGGNLSFQQQSIVRQSAEDFSVVRRPVSASALRRKFTFGSNSSTAAAADESGAAIPSADTSNSIIGRKKEAAGGGAVSLGVQNEMNVAFRGATSPQGNATDVTLELSAMQLAAEAELDRQRRQQEEELEQKRAEQQMMSHFEERRTQSASIVQRWWRRVLSRLRTGTVKSLTDTLFDEAATFLSTTNQQRWTKRDTMLLHDIARRLHFLRCIGRIERFCSGVWIPKHFAVLKMQAAVRCWIWRKRDQEHRRRRKACIAIQRWVHECGRRSVRRKQLRLRREEAIKARALRAARSAASAIRPPPPAEVDGSLVERQVILPDGSGAAPFATLGPGNMCVEVYEQGGGAEGHLYGDEDLLQQQQNAEDGREEDVDVSAGATEEDALARRKRGGRPRSAAERFLVRPGHRVSSFTAKMLRFCDEDLKKKPPTGGAVGRPASAGPHGSQSRATSEQNDAHHHHHGGE